MRFVSIDPSCAKPIALPLTKQRFRFMGAPVALGNGGYAVLFCAAGDNHGAMDRLYQDVSAFEASLGVRCDYVLHVGGFGIWPDPSRTGKATCRHEARATFRCGSMRGEPCRGALSLSRVWPSSHPRRRGSFRCPLYRAQQVAMPRNLVAIDMEPSKRDLSLLGEYAAMRM